MSTQIDDHSELVDLSKDGSAVSGSRPERAAGQRKRRLLLVHEEEVLLVRPDPELYYGRSKKFEDVADPRVVKLWRAKQFKQRTPEWFQARMLGISASDVALALNMNDSACDYYIEHFDLQEKFKKNPKKCCNGYSNIKELITKKCNRSDTSSNISNEFMLWGQKYENIVQTIYSQMRQEDVLEFGLLFHPKIPFLMASPDGITTSGTMLEIKCPTSRPVGPVPPLHYFMQMLMQLECCELDECDFFDCRFVEYMFEDEWKQEAEEWWRNNPTATHHIYGLLMKKETVESGAQEEDKYIYPPPSVVTVDQFLDWASQTAKDYMLDYEQGLQRTFYKLDQYFLTRVRRNDEWLQKNFDRLQQVWNRIEYFRSEEGRLDYEKYIQGEPLFPPEINYLKQQTLDQVLSTSFARLTVSVNVELTLPQRKPKTTKTTRKKKLDTIYPKCVC